VKQNCEQHTETGFIDATMHSTFCSKKDVERKETTLGLREATERQQVLCYAPNGYIQPVEWNSCKNAESRPIRATMLLHCDSWDERRKKTLSAS
jgi:hypothetical protein